MNTKYMVVISAFAVVMIGATAFGTTNSVFAYEKSQAVSQVNDCGNGGEDHERPNGVSTMNDPIEGGAENVGCQNTASQIQGDDNVAALYSAQEFDD
jgi:hypothetical protein